MRELVILCSSSSIVTPPPNPSSHHSPKPKPKPSSLSKHIPSSGLHMIALAKGISKNLRERNVDSVVDALNTADQLGLPPSQLFDAASMDLLKTECLRIVNFGRLEDIILLMETLAGYSFSIKELVEPSRVIKLCVHQRNPHLAVRYARLFPHEGILMCSIVKQFGKKGDLDSALAAYEAYMQHSTVPDMYLYRALIDVCGLCGDYMQSRYIFEDIVSQKVIPNIFVFNSLMNVNAHDLGYTLHVYKKMQNLGVTADMTSYNILLKSCSLAGKVDLAQDIYREAKQLELAGLLKLDDFTYCTIIKIFADAKLWQLALKIKEDMLSSGVTPNTFTWSSLISASANAGLVDQAIKLFEEMLLAGCVPNSHCCNILLHACVEACQYDRAFRLFNAWKGSEIQNTFTTDYNCPVDDISSAMHACEDYIITVPNLASNSLHLSFLKKFPFTPSSATYNTLMKACGSDYNRAKALMDEMQAVGLSPNHISWSILIDICGSSGNMEGAIQILKNMRMAGIEPDVIAYTTAIKVSVESKNLKMAFSLFAEMKRYQLKPNLVTYDTLLRARTRYGSLKEVQQCLAIYQDMRKAGYKSNDNYLKQLIEEWCEGVIQDNDQCQDDFKPCKRAEFGRPHSLLLEKVAAHLHHNVAESLSVDLQGLTKVEARIVVLAVLRMVKENYIQGHLVKDDMSITLGIDKVDVLPATQKAEVKDAIFKLLHNELGLEVLIVVPRYTADLETDLEIPLNSYQNWSKSSGRENIRVSSARRPLVLQRLKVTRNSLHSWLQRKAGALRR
ncbi:pentatricopeptide repeat-containing protein At5g02830, chloroplastic [Ricinus communis]|uniref:Pentatricopeptide repeat-containing protein, putative n=1 Tax=Ricinus communis TaxID=3988 RepID=B9SGS7_RICCO|nr:pentatricopeptide repeat-containing protein At5g02830, chloroplastic [Ricinus communis]EEF37162.1 pentatricopeptide repeat-containing protein, putative [Ricinus communis]|eukprot:XP_002525196.1 pentatricopeptide repeat-containing protein At5g02830, chloroplastic [Ricinus communis]